ncbi:PDZ domain-containing protein [Streptomyces sp. Qhu-G9]|uniref:PDZ domain-containing protein n=1 Tax=Streptomyces sp. Qhu-G9 TaxID=3452799 RepID=UPI0022AC05C2|nr:PDZ domain-containing protein [Streptomyces aurantiacus]WAU84317.1 PDZ domain-containing protein [Streptomyces aurantiacus]
MEQTALRPKPMPGQEPDDGRPSAPVRRPHAARRRGRRLTTLLFSLFVGAVLVLSGVGLGTVGATVIGMSKLADFQRRAGAPGASTPPAGAGGAEPVPGAGSSASLTRAPERPQAPPDGRPQAPSGGGPRTPSEGRPQTPPDGRPRDRPTLGVEAVDASDGPGALLVGVHVPGPGHTAGLVRGDILLTFGGTRLGTAADLARAVAAARPGTAVRLTLRHAGGGHQQLSVTPGVIT